MPFTLDQWLVICEMDIRVGLGHQQPPKLPSCLALALRRSLTASSRCGPWVTDLSQKSTHLTGHSLPEIGLQVLKTAFLQFMKKKLEETLSSKDMAQRGVL